MSIVRVLVGAAACSILVPGAAGGQDHAVPASTRAGEPARGLASLVSDADYPASALRAGEQGRVDFEVHVDAAGGVSDCAVTASSGSAALDAQTCRIIRTRARFRPAVSATGEPVPDVVRSAITWRIEPGELIDEPEQLARLVSHEDYPWDARAAGKEGMVEFRLDIAPNGNLTACTVTQSGGTPSLDAATCSIMRYRAFFRPSIGDDGVARATSMTSQVHWRLPSPASPAIGNVSQ